MKIIVYQTANLFLIAKVYLFLLGFVFSSPFKIIVALLVGFLPHVLLDLGIISFYSKYNNILFLHIKSFYIKIIGFL